MIKIYIDGGHGGNDPGATANGLREKDLTLSISKKIAHILKDYDCTVKLSRTDDKTLSLKQRTDDANKWGADFLLSIHINAGGGTGYEDFIYNGLSNSSATAKLRDTIHDEIVKELNVWHNRGKRKANFHMLRESKMPAMLSENGFIDTKADADRLKTDEFLNKIALGHAKGLIKAFGLKKTSASKPKKDSNTNTSKPSKKPSTPSKNKTVAQMAQEVIDGKHGNGHANRQKSLGVNKVTYEKVRAEVNRRAGIKTAPKPKGKSIAQMATEVINGEHGNGHARRRKSLGISQADYNKVRAEVNRRLR